MKSLLCVIALISCFAVTGSVQAADTSSAINLKAMNLSSMQSMSDAEGMDVRGNGFYRVRGFFRSYTPALTTSSYSISSTTSGVSKTTSFSIGGFTVYSRSFSY